MSSSCSFNCSGPPPKYEPDNDITGVGVVINYIVTSALGILIMIVYYVTSFDPSNDPFGYTIRGGAPPYRSNAWDMLLLYWIRSGPRYLLKRWRGPEFVMSNNTRYRLEEILVKCVILMGDMQIVTGLAILVSGYVQLQCGLASFKWRIILDLAWFSCLTHLSCLTMLRCHLYSHQLERVWRLSAMGTLAILLATGRLLTANERWSRAGGGRDAVPALCLIQASSAIEALEGASVTYTIQLPEDAKLSAIGWVIAAFVWGLWRIIFDLSGGLSDNLEHVALGRQAWTFGQIVSVLTLLAPIISIVGAWREGRFST
ncbi:hypothetical protein LEL_07178 [Akanthomyces lecanii RCEF 1005]|uniref:Uncharacterized protein n=1 Tax=Akanthomyces lecanii RCEF 1005 TaxID=1081108 RepID=A0A168FHD7_CORDF|nr:hypothetical protein LEL_07178 [Akanthomyces lecanii RCEF 1005]